jgi:hypothetical protein
MGIIAPAAPAFVDLTAPPPAHDLTFWLANQSAGLVPRGLAVPVHASPPDSLGLSLKI